jgi:Zn-dependent protease with chaperone function
MVEETAYRLQVEPVEIFVAPSNVPNAYTFGLSSPKTIVLNSVLFQMMDRDEMQFIQGHEMGHVCLGHTWLNSLVGGLAGIPSPPEAALLLVLAFRWWNRACEYSCDRAGLLACGKPQKAISALTKLGMADTPHEALVNRSIQHTGAGAQETGWTNLNELFATHPVMARRIQHLREYLRTAEYRRLQSFVDKNIP